MFRVLLPNGLNLTLELENASKDMTVADFARTVRRKVENEITEAGSRKVHWGPQVYVEDAMGERIEDGNIICFRLCQIVRDCIFISLTIISPAIELKQVYIGQLR